MQKIIINRGLPASGKSTYAKELVKNSEGNLKRINRDDIRDMIDNGIWSKENEKNVINVRNVLIENFLKKGYDIIIDDTNLDQKTINGIDSLLRKISSSLKKEFEIVVKWHEVNINEAINRNSNRQGRHRIPDDAIYNMHNKYKLNDEKNPIKKSYSYIIGSFASDIELSKIQRNKIIDKCIVCDIDGTLSIMGNRSPYEWHKVGIDTPNIAVKELLNSYWNIPKLGGEYNAIVIVSGRDEICRNETEDWLDKHGINYDCLYMRKQNDNRKDSIVKKEIYYNDIYPNFDVQFWLDDRQQVVDMIRNELNLPCFQVNYSPD